MTQHSIYNEQDHQIILDIILQEITTWDPLGLIAMGAPMNEYDFEAVKITDKLEASTSITRIVDIVAQVFKKAFNDKRFTHERCHLVAARIYERLCNNGFLTND